MTDAELLAFVKKGLGIFTDFQDDIITVYIEEVKDFMREAGVDETIIGSSASAGLIRQGVLDLWNYKSGEVKFSRYFEQRLIQLSRKRVVSDVQT